MKPVVLPMLHLLRAGQNRNAFIRNIRLLSSSNAEHALEFVREDFDETRDSFVPVVQYPFAPRAASQFHVPADQVENDVQILRLSESFEVHGFKIAALVGEVSALIVDISDSAAHSCREIASARTEHDDQSVCHVLAAVVPDAFDDSSRSGIANGKALAGNS